MTEIIVELYNKRMKSHIIILQLLTNLLTGETRKVAVDERGQLEFEIEKAAGFRYYSYRVL